MSLTAERTIPCRLCGRPTPMLGTKLCNPCWETDRAVTSNPDLARRILAGMAPPMTTPTNEEVRRQFEAWSTAKPTKPGYYLVRGFQLDRDKQSAACVEVRAKRGSLICNLHECNSDLDKRDEESWYPLADLDDTLQWVELVQSPAVVALVEAANAVADFTPEAQREKWSCHYGITTAAKCGRCSRETRLAAALAPFTTGAGHE